MASTASISIDFAEKFASKLAHALESSIAIAANPKTSINSGIEILRIVGTHIQSSQSLQTDLKRVGFREEDFACEISRIAIDSNRRILAIDASERCDRSIWIFVPDPDVAKVLIDTLVAATRSQVEWENSKSNSDCSHIELPAEEYTESFIEQITQDFEELTWLRQSHRFADLYSVNASSVEVAQTCVASLAQVIHAESLLFLELFGLHLQHSVDPARLHVLAGPPSQCSAWSLEQLTQELTDQGRKTPVLLDRSRDEMFLQRFPFIRNCMLTVVGKGDRVYGWLIAINKSSADANCAASCDLSGNPTEARFSTFEAGLLTTAANILASQASNSELFAAQEELTKGLVLAIINAIDAKDCYTAGHSERVASFAKCLASRIGFTKKECEQMHMAGLLHDVGKIGIPDAILKKPDKLTNEEFDAIKAHPVIGYSILRHLTSIDYVLPGVLFHHEAYNGSGYPHGLKGQDIPPMARILAVCDAFDAMTSTRPYRNALSLEEATRILRNDAGKMWDTEFVEILLACIRDGLIAPGKVATSEAVPRSMISEMVESPNFTNPPRGHSMAYLTGLV
jgi:HD-GYP domain-containing protein (c-di-GMP phosphodiesterase class II)